MEQASWHVESRADCQQPREAALAPTRHLVTPPRSTPHTALHQTNGTPDRGARDPMYDLDPPERVTLDQSAVQHRWPRDERAPEVFV